MDRASNDQRDADATEMGDEGSARVVDDGDRAWPEAQIGCARFEQPTPRNDHEARPLELLGIGKARGECVEGQGEFSEQVGKLGELAAVLEKHCAIDRIRGGGLAHEVALPFLP